MMRMMIEDICSKISFFVNSLISNERAKGGEREKEKTTFYFSRITPMKISCVLDFSPAHLCPLSRVKRHIVKHRRRQVKEYAPLFTWKEKHKVFERKPG